MPQYAALIYGEDADWMAPEHAGQMAEYGRSAKPPRTSSGAAPPCSRRRPPPPSR